MNPKRHPNLFVEEAEGEWLVFDESSESVAALNAPAAAVFELCDGTRDVDEIVAELADTPNPTDEYGVQLALSELAEAGLIDYAGDRPAMSRRKALLMLGVAAISLPVVERIIASTGPEPKPSVTVGGLPPTSPTPMPTPNATPAPYAEPYPAPYAEPYPAPVPAPSATPAPTPAPSVESADVSFTG